MRHGVYAHPWDLRELSDGAGLARLRELGLQDVALATAYHAGRWLTPHGGGLVRFLEDGVVHFRPRADYGVLRPLASSEVPDRGASPLAALCSGAAGAGLRAAAWTVLFHNSRLGRAHPGSCVRNALGDVYEYALCPARPEVREYGVALLGDIARHQGLGTVELEAAGFHGYRHGSHHDKSSFAVTGHVDFLLSYCFCDCCVPALTGRGADGEALAARVRSLLARALSEADALAPPAGGEARAWLERELGAGELEVMLAHRRDVHRGMLQAARAAVPDGVELALHAVFDPLFTGSQMGQPLADLDDLVDEIVVTHYGESPRQIADAWRGRRAGRAAVRLAIWPRAPQFETDDDVREVVEVARAAGCAGLRIYHLGLLPWRTIERVTALLAVRG